MEKRNKKTHINPRMNQFLVSTIEIVLLFSE